LQQHGALAFCTRAPVLTVGWHAWVHSLYLPGMRFTTGLHCSAPLPSRFAHASLLLAACLPLRTCNAITFGTTLYKRLLRSGVLQDMRWCLLACGMDLRFQRWFLVSVLRVCLFCILLRMDCVDCLTAVATVIPYCVLFCHDVRSCLWFFRLMRLVMWLSVLYVICSRDIVRLPRFANMHAGARCVCGDCWVYGWRRHNQFWFGFTPQKNGAAVVFIASYCGGNGQNRRTRCHAATARLRSSARQVYGDCYALTRLSITCNAL